MTQTSQNRLVMVSARIYARLLSIYPKAFRRQYGPAMVHLFADLCRDACRVQGGLGLLPLWARVLVDLVKTSACEHINNSKSTSIMFHRILTQILDSPTLRKNFAVIFGAIFLVSLLGSCFLAFGMPEQYASIARIKLQKPGAVVNSSTASTESDSYDPFYLRSQFELIQSDQFLGVVVQKLKQANSSGDNDAEAIKHLRESLFLRPVRNVSPAKNGLVEVRVFHADAQQAAVIVNTLVDTYQEFNLEQARANALSAKSTSTTVVVIDRAEPAPRPARPNRPATLFLGLFGGGCLAFLVASVMVFFFVAFRTPPPRTAVAV